MENELKHSNDLPLDLNFIVPTELVELPSKGLLYPEGHPLKNKEAVEIKQMTAKEEDILTNRNLIKKGVVLDRLIQSLLIDKSIDSKSLSISDRNAILITARISAYGEKYTTQVTCPSCNTNVHHSFNLLEKFEEEQEELNVDFDKDGNFSLVLPSTKWKVVCRSLNGFDEQKILKSSQDKKNESFLLEQLKLMIVSVQDVTDKDIISKALDNLPAKDSLFLRQEYNKAVPTFDLKKTFECKNCEYSAEMEVPLTADFFWVK